MAGAWLATVLPAVGLADEKPAVVEASVGASVDAASLTQLARLLDTLRSRDIESVETPVKALITAAAYTGRIEQDVAHIDAELTIRVLGRPWVELPIALVDAPIISMSASDEKILLQGTGNGTYALLFPSAGEHKVWLKLMTRVQASPEGSSIEFRVPPAALTTFSLTVPQRKQTIECAQGLILERDDGEDFTLVNVSCGATETLGMHWRPQAKTVPQVPGLAMKGEATGVLAEQTPVPTAAPAVALPVKSEPARTTSVDTVISKALIEATVGEDKSVTYRCRYRLTTGELQPLSLEVPLHAEVVELLVGGKRIDIEKSSIASTKDHQAYEIDVVRETPASEPFVVSAVFRAPFKQNPVRSRGGNLSLPLPRIVAATANGPAAIAAQQLRTAVWVPRDVSLVGTPARFVSDRATTFDLFQGAVGYESTNAGQDAWFGEPSRGSAFAPAGRAYVYDALGTVDVLTASYWRTTWYAWLISGAVLLIGLVLARTTWENRLTVLLLAGFAAAMYSLYDADLIVNVVAAARWGTLAMLAYWLIQTFARRTATTNVRPETRRAIGRMVATSPAASAA